MEITTIMNLMLYDVGGVTVLGEGFAYALSKVSEKIFDAVADKVLPDKTPNVFGKLYTVMVNAVEYVADERYKKDADRILDTAEKICNGWGNTRFLSTGIIKEALRCVKSEPVAEQTVWLWLQKFAEGLLADNELREFFQFETLQNINKITIETNAQVKEIEKFLKKVFEDQKEERKAVISFPEYISDFPLPSGECFIGRNKIIDDIVEELVHKNSCYLYSIGGIGKTEIAKKVVNKLENILSVDSGIERIAWINYQDGNFKLSICKGLTETKNIDDINKAWKKSLSLFQRYKDKLLIVVDNIEGSVEDEFQELVEHTKCRFLITSRWDGFHLLKKISVEELALEDCLSLFNYYYNGRKNNLIAGEIIQLVERHTVMVELLAKMAAAEEWSLDVFKQRLVCAGFDISEEEIKAAHSELKKERKVIEQLKILYKVIGCSVEEEQLLVKISVMPSMPFPFSKARNWFDLRNRTALRHLVKFGWINQRKRTGESETEYWIHSVIASAVRSQFEEILYEKCKPLLYIISEELNYENYEYGSIKKELIQFSWAVNDCLKGHLCDETDALFLKRMARVYKDIANYKNAELLLKQALEIYDSCGTESKVHIADVYNSLGMLCVEKKRFDEAMSCFEHALGYFHGEEETAYLASIYNNMGLVHLQRRELKEAMEHFVKAHGIMYRLYGDGAFEELGIKENIAHTYLAECNYTEAEKIYNELVTGYGNISSESKMNLSSIYSQMARMKEECGNEGEACKLYYKALKIRENELGKYHPYTTDIRNSLAVILTAQGKYDEALAEYNEILKYNIDIFGENNPDVGVIYNNIGLVYLNKEKYKIAMEYFCKAEKIYVAFFGENSPEICFIYNNIGYAYAEDGEIGKAVSYHEKALKLYIQAYGKIHIDVAQTYNDLAAAYWEELNSEMVYKYAGEAISILQELFHGEPHPILSTAYNTLGLALEKDGNISEALECICYARQIYLELNSEPNPENIEIMDMHIGRIQNRIIADGQ